MRQVHALGECSEYTGHSNLGTALTCGKGAESAGVGDGVPSGCARASQDGQGHVACGGGRVRAPESGGVRVRACTAREMGAGGGGGKGHTSGARRHAYTLHLGHSNTHLFLTIRLISDRCCVHT